MPTALLALVFFVVVPLFPGDLPARDTPDLRPVHIAAAPTSPGQAAGPSADSAALLVERSAEYLRAMRLEVLPHPAGGYLVAQSGPTAAPQKELSRTGPAAVVELTVGFNSAHLSDASGAETRFGGEDDAAWRLASRVQRSIIGGMSDVLGYETYDRGIREQEHGRGRAGTALSSTPAGSWVATYPLFQTNRFEAGLIESPGAIEVLAVAIANAVAEYFDPLARTPARTVQAGWTRDAAPRPVDPKTLYQADVATKVAFTFDGGASSVPTPAILKALKDAGVRATMFMTADFVERNPDLVVLMAREGHEFGNHSSTHPDMTTITNAEIVAELDRLESAVVALTGKSTRPWFRPPFGAINDRVMHTVAGQGYYSIMWTADSADWRADVAADVVASRLLRYSEHGAIMIQHLGSPQSAQVLPWVLKALAERGVAVAPLSEVLVEP